MPESPDFEQIAERLILATIEDGSRATVSRARIVEQLRLVWNARGAADIARVNGSLLTGSAPRIGPLMPEPDFDQIADKLLASESLSMFRAENRDLLKMYLVSLQREAWNARGEADTAVVKKELVGTCPHARHSDPDNSGLCITCGVVLDYMEPDERAEQLDRVIRSLDR